MSKKNHIQSNSKTIKPKYTVRQALTNYYLLVMFTLFPLFLTSNYSNIRHDKCYLFIIFTVLLFAAELLLGLSETDKSPQKGKMSVGDTVQQFAKKLSFTDWAVIVFLAVNIISTLLSDYPLSSFWGESEHFSASGRNSGLLLMICYVTAYFLITRFFHYFEYIFAAFSCGAALVFILALLNGVYIDPFNMHAGLSLKNTLNFISTIGNKNILSSFICIALPVSVAMSVHTQKNILRALYLAVSGLGFSALMVADSDSGILGIGIFLAVYLIWYSRRIERLKFYLFNVFIMLLSARIYGLFVLLTGGKVMPMDAYQEFFVFSNASIILLASVGIITCLLFVLDSKKPGIVRSKAVPITLVCLFVLATIAAICAVLYFSLFDTKTDLGSLETILRFNDKWGTHRGFMWIRSMWIFNDFSFVDKLFGSGPDTFYFPFSIYFNDLMKFGDSSTNAAHNEYINYLITIGITGLASYLAIIGGAIASSIKYAKKNPLAIVCASAVICYAVQAIVNIAQPITTPLFFIFIALCESVARNTK